MEESKNARIVVEPVGDPVTLVQCTLYYSARVVKFELDIDITGREWQRPQDAYADDFRILADAIITAIQTQRIEFPFRPNKPAEA